VAVGVTGAPCYIIKAISLSKFSDPSRPLETIMFATSLSFYFGPFAWSFLYALFAPVLAGAPNSDELKRTMKRVFVVCGGLCALVNFVVTLVQLQSVEGEGRVAVSTVFFTSMGSIALLIMTVFGTGGYKVVVRRFLVICLILHHCNLPLSLLAQLTPLSSFG
jgi:hypothetical protein